MCFNLNKYQRIENMVEYFNAVIVARVGSGPYIVRSLTLNARFLTRYYQYLSIILKIMMIKRVRRVQLIVNCTSLSLIS